MTMIIAHRGYSGEYPENTMLAFKKAIEIKADGIELDVHLSKDGEAVVMHDGKLDRTTNGTGNIADLEYSEIAKLDAGKGEHPPRLDEVLALCKKHDTFLNIELKARGTEVKSIELVKHHGMLSGVLLSSFNHDLLVRASALEPGIRIAALVSTSPGIITRMALGKMLNTKQTAVVGEALKIHAHAINPPYLTCNQAFMDYAREKGLDIYPWTVDSVTVAKRLAKWGATGIITNQPELMIRKGVTNPNE